MFLQKGKVGLCCGCVELCVCLRASVRWCVELWWWQSFCEEECVLVWRWGVLLMFERRMVLQWTGSGGGGGFGCDIYFLVTNFLLLWYWGFWWVGFCMVVLFRAELVLREISFVSEIFFVGLHFLLNCNLIEGISRMTSFF